jgi:hypothetical protein
VKLLKLIANIGYGSRKEVTAMFRDGRITDVDGRELSVDDAVDPQRVRVDGAALDPSPGFVLMLHKPAGYTCSTRDAGSLVYDLFPPRFRRRSPTRDRRPSRPRYHRTAAADRRRSFAASDRFAALATGESLRGDAGARPAGE